jgi:hypothetical protein
MDFGRFLWGFSAFDFDGFDEFSQIFCEFFGIMNFVF